MMEVLLIHRQEPEESHYMVECFVFRLWNPANIQLRCRYFQPRHRRYGNGHYRAVVPGLMRRTIFSFSGARVSIMSSLVPMSMRITRMAVLSRSRALGLTLT